MKILVIGKAPPLQGGVAVRTFAFVRKLAELGHTVTYVTNSESAGSNYLAAFDDSDIEYRRAALAKVNFLSLAPLDGTTHIPQSTDYETRLLGIASQAAQHADLVIGWYFQPYGVVAALLALMYGKPCVVVHAGSDLGRLSAIPDFNSAYRAIFKSCNFVAIRPRNVALLVERIAIPRNQIILSHAGCILPSYFHEHIRTLSITQLRTLTQKQMEILPLDPVLKQRSANLNQKEIDLRLPILGIYGKTGEQKGHHEAVFALSRLADAGQQFQLVLCVGGHRRSIEKLLTLILSSEKLSERTFVFPFVAPWRIPGFIKLCDTVAFLERNFEIAFHGPQVPKEVLWCGRALICSTEIHEKQSFRSELIDNENFIDAGDPRDIDRLTAVFRRALESKTDLRKIGYAGAQLIRKIRESAGEADGIIEALSANGIIVA